MKIDNNMKNMIEEVRAISHINIRDSIETYPTVF